jgi:hypothetical protein
MMPGIECPSAAIPERFGSEEAKAAQCRQFALRAGFLTLDATGRFDRKEGWKEGEGPTFRRK